MNEELIQEIVQGVDDKLRNLPRAQYIEALDSIREELSTFANASREDEENGL